MAGHVFISYARPDRPLAERVCALLEQHDMTCWIAPRNMPPGAHWQVELDRAISASSAVLVLVSPHSNESKDVEHEVTFADHEKRHIVPVRIDGALPGAKLRYFMQNLHQVDVASADAEPQLLALARALKTMLVVADPVPDTAASAPAAHVPGVPNNLPGSLTSFVGRREEVEKIVQALAARQPRLITLVGPGGAGKTRLAIHAAGGALESSPDGVWFVPLADVRDADRLGPAIANVLDVALKPDIPFVAQLGRAMLGKRVLILLDNFEQVTGGERLVSDLLRGVPDVQILATSRRNLGIQGGRELTVSPLPLPPLRGLRGLISRVARKSTTVEHLVQYASVQLFLERAHESFALTDDNAGAVAEICVRLDGIPLAIELAAAQTSVFSPEEILENLAARFSILEGPSELPERQQTLRKTIDWSHDLLSDEEKLFFAGLGVFADGFTLAAAQSVCRTGDAMTLLKRLVDKSLVARRDRRFFMLESIRDYAADKLVGDDAYLRAVEYFQRLLRADSPAYTAEARYQEIDPELGNVVFLARWCFEAGRARAADRERLWPPVVTFVELLADHLWARGYWDERVALAQHAIEVHRWRGDAAGAGRQMYAVAWVYWQRGRLDEAATWAAQCRDSMTSLGDPAFLCLPHHITGLIALKRRRFDEARAEFVAALACKPAGTGVGSEPSIKMELGHLARAEGHLDEARTYYEDALTLNDANGSVEGIAISRGYLGAVQEAQGDRAAAERSYTDALTGARAVGRLTTVARCLVGLARVLRHRGEVEPARAHVAEALAIYRQLDTPDEIAALRRDFPDA
jgi:predicted ATPase